MKHKFKAKDHVLIASGAHAGIHAEIISPDNEPGEPAYILRMDGDPDPMTYLESELEVAVPGVQKEGE